MSDDRDALRAWLELLGAAGDLKKSIDAKFRDHFGVSISRFDVLATLDRVYPAGLRAGELSERLRVTEGNVTQVAQPLVRDRLVRRANSENDGRVAILSLTKKGKRLFAEMAEQHRLWVDDAFAALDPEQLQMLRALLAGLRRPLAPAQARKDAA